MKPMVTAHIRLQVTDGIRISIQEKLYELTALDNDALTDAVNYFSDGEATYMGLITQFEDQIINASAGSGDADTATVIPARVEGDSRALVEGAAVSADTNMSARRFPRISSVRSASIRRAILRK